MMPRTSRATTSVYALAPMGNAAHSGILASFTQVFPASRLALLSLAGLFLALLGALQPAIWAARARAITALRSE